jgi:hypothetical protein
MHCGVNFMNTLTNASAILVVEDDDRDFSQIVEAVAKAGCAAERLTIIKENLLINYKAVHPESQIIIADLNLEAVKRFEYKQGLEVIREKLWPFDRTAFFVVFSEFIPESLTGSFDLFEPHWCFIRKTRVKGGCDRYPLDQECMDRLTRVLAQMVAYCAPNLDTPHYESHQLLASVDEYTYGQAGRKYPTHYAAKEAIVNSVAVLNQLARACISYSKAGQVSGDVGVGVFGSTGRLERRSVSDVEMSAYYEDGDKAMERKRLAFVMWNRTAKYMEHARLKYQGQDRVKRSPDGLLNPSESGEMPENKFMPVIRNRYLFETDPRVDARIRDRHVQILCELRPVFNPELIFELKKKLVQTQVGGSIRRVWDVLASTYFSEVITQFLLDTNPESLVGEDAKAFIFRTLNMLALRLRLIGLVRFDDPKLASIEEWRGFLDALCEPGIIKVVRFTNACAQAIPEDSVKEALDDVIQTYFSLVASFSADAEGDMRRPARACGESLRQVFDVLSQVSSFRGLRRQLPWLFTNDSLIELLVRI